MIKNNEIDFLINSLTNQHINYKYIIYKYNI